MTTVLDGAGEGSAKASWVLIRRSKKRTGLGPQVPSQNLHRFRKLYRADRKSRTGIGPHLPAPPSGYAHSAFGRNSTRRSATPRATPFAGQAHSTKNRLAWRWATKSSTR